MSTLSVSLAEQTLAELVREEPCRARARERWSIEYCCRGRQTLANACAAKRLDVEEVIQDLDYVMDSPTIPCEKNWSQAALADVIGHIVDCHHTYLRAELPRLALLSNQVLAAHGGHYTELFELRRVIVKLRDELVYHMLKEEHVLFPIIERLEAAAHRKTMPLPYVCGSVGNPIGLMMLEHHDCGAALARIRALTNDFQPPSEACLTWRLLLQGLKRLSFDLHWLIHEENNILFPRAVALERRLDFTPIHHED